MAALKKILVLMALGGMLAGCAGTPYSPTSFTPTGIDTSAYVAKVDAFVVVMDASSSMNFDHEDRKNFYSAKDVVTHLNQTIPELGYKAALVGLARVPASIARMRGWFMGPKPTNVPVSPMGWHCLNVQAGLRRCMKVSPPVVMP